MGLEFAWEGKHTVDQPSEGRRDRNADTSGFKMAKTGRGLTQAVSEEKKIRHKNVFQLSHRLSRAKMLRRFLPLPLLLLKCAEYVLWILFKARMNGTPRSPKFCLHFIVVFT